MFINIASDFSVLQTANSRFVPRTVIETSAILSLDEDIKLNSDEVCYANYLLTQSEVFMGKFKTEILQYRPSNRKVNTARFRCEIFPLRSNV